MAKQAAWPPHKEAGVKYNLFYVSAAQANDIACLPKAVNGAMIETTFANVTLHCQAGSDGLRLTVTSNGNCTQTEADLLHEKVASQLDLTERWISILGSSCIEVWGCATAPHCSITVPDAALQGEGEDFLDGLVATADSIVSGTLCHLLGVSVTRIYPEN